MQVWAVERMIRKEFVQKDGLAVARVTFMLPSNTWSDGICLVGDFNGWNRTSHPFRQQRDGSWALTMDFECNKVYQFRYLCDRECWANDNQADGYVWNSYGSDNCLLITDPGFKPNRDLRH